MDTPGTGHSYYTGCRCRLHRRGGFDPCTPCSNLAALIRTLSGCITAHSQGGECSPSAAPSPCRRGSHRRRRPGIGRHRDAGNHRKPDGQPVYNRAFRRSGPGCRRSDYLQRNTCLFSKNRYGHGRFPDGSHLRRIRLRFIKPEGFGSRNARFNRYRTELLLQCT